MPHKDPEKRRAASRASQRRRRSASANGGAHGRSGVDKPKKTSTPAGPLDPADVLARLAAELDQLDAAPNLDPAVRARTVARVCAVALAAHKQAEPGGDDDEPFDYSGLSDRQLATLRRLSGMVRRADA